MNDNERYAWWGTVPDHLQDKWVHRTFKGKPEFWVYIENRNDDAGRELNDTCDTLKEAMRQYEQALNDGEVVAVEVEEVIGEYNIVDCNLQNREYKTVIQHGTFTES